MTVNIPAILTGFKAVLEGLEGVEVYDYWPESPNFPCVLTILERIPWDHTESATFVSYFMCGMTDTQSAQLQLMDLVVNATDLIVEHGTLDGAVSSVIPLEVRSWSPEQVQEGRPRYWQAEQVWDVFITP